MSKTTDSINSEKMAKMPVGSATFYNEKKSSPAPLRPTKTPPKFYEVSSMRVVDTKKSTSKNLPDLKKKEPFREGNLYSAAFHEIAMQQKDERFKYLLKHGELRKVEKGGNIIFSELPQIPNIWVCYRRPCERDTSVDKLNLDNVQLTHLPLLEGQEKLKMLTFQHNKINRLENLISLPNLLYLDLYDNSIREIENLSILTNLKVLLLPKNQISKIKNISDLVKLEVLDLHSNKITKIEGFGMLNAMRIVNLANNQISKIENLDYLQNLTQLNLKLNTIGAIENIRHLSKLEKLYLANNRIEIKLFDQSDLTRLTLLKEVTLENNPCSKNRGEYMRNIIKYLPFVKNLDGKPPTLDNQAKDSDEEQDHSEVLKLIASQWVQEKKRLVQLQKTGAPKRDFLKLSCITGGHAEIEDESILFIYGNSYDVVLNNQTFQESVEKIRFEYIYFEFLIEPNILQMIKKFKKLKVVEFRNNYIGSLLQIAKLQNLNTLKAILIEPDDNPVVHCSFLKEFVVYRFPNIIQVNKDDIKQADRQKAKQLFHHFDRVLQIPEKFYNPENLKVYPSQDPETKKDRTYLKTFNKVLNEAAEAIMSDVAGKVTGQVVLRSDLDKVFEQAILHLIAKVEH